MNCFVYLPRGLLTLLTIYLTFGLGTTRLNAQIITTVAGNGTDGFSGDGGLATNAGLSLPYGVAVDAQGNLFIADVNTNSIQKVTPNGIITTVAGISGPQGFSGDGGPATQARLRWPTNIAIDAQGNLLIADTGNHRIRKVTPDDIITTIVGTDTKGYGGDGGPASQASLNFPEGIALDGQGNLFIADVLNARIRKVASNGIITTVAGNGSFGYSGEGIRATQASLYRPASIALDGWGNLYISDTNNGRVFKVDHTGIIRTVAGNGTHGFNGDGLPATRALLTFPEGITVDVEGNLFISDSYNYRIRKVDRSGMIATVAGSGVAPGYGGDSGLATNANLNQPTGVTLDAAGNLFIADKANHRIRKVTAIAPALVVTSFILINANANTRQEIKTILPGETINLASLPTKNLNIMVRTSSDVVGSVRMVLSGRQNRTQLETGAPYALFGERNGYYNAWIPAVGQYTLTATAYTAGGGMGSASAPLSVSFTVIDQPETVPQVTSFSLMNADTEQEIKTLTAGEELNLASLPQNLNIRANTSPATVGSVRMVLSGQQSRTQTETGAPYALWGDNNGNYNNWTPALGTYTLTGTAYSGASASGQAGPPLTISFRVVRQTPLAKVSAESGTEEVLVYPNPFTESFRIRNAGQQPVILYDLTGRRVWSFHILFRCLFLQVDY